jgi:hypothetical protein
MTQAYPLQWPFGWARTPIGKMRRSEFGNHSIAECTQEIIRQLNLLRAKSVVISTNLRVRNDGLPYSNQRQPDDPGVAVYFRLVKSFDPQQAHSGQAFTDHVLACDRWDLVEDNLWAVAKHVDALRGQQRWGVGNVEQAFAGYQALPPASDPDAWWTVLHVERTADWDQIRDAYRLRVKQTHPDVGGDQAEFIKIQRAYEAAAKERGKQ